MRSVFLIVSMSVGILTLSHATSEQASGVDCTHAQGGYEQSYCASRLADAADVELNSSYRRLKDSLTTEEVRKLVQIESKWIALRDEICDFETLPAIGGTGWPAFYSECIARLTKNRIIDLKAAIDYRQ